MGRQGNYDGFDLSNLKSGVILTPEEMEVIVKMSQDPSLDETMVLVLPDPMEAFGA